MLKNADAAATKYAVAGTPTFIVAGAPGAPDPVAALRTRSGVVLGGARSAVAVRLRASIAAAALVGAAIAAYLTYVHYSHTAPICVNSGCETVQKSKYAELGGVPVALLGLIAYLAIVATTAVRGTVAAFIGVLISFAGVAFSGYLLWAQLGPIGAICQWCLGNDVMISIVAVLCVVRLLTEPGPSHGYVVPRTIGTALGGWSPDPARADTDGMVAIADREDVVLRDGSTLRLRPTNARRRAGAARVLRAFDA